MRWLDGLDQPTDVVLACPDAVLAPLPADIPIVVVQGCLAPADIGLPAQILASGTRRVWVVGCQTADQEVAALIDRWQAILPDVRLGPPPVRRPPRKSKARVFTLGSAPVERRALFGLGGRRATMLDLDTDEATRGVAALRLLEAEGRARLVGDPDGGGTSAVPVDLIASNVHAGTGTDPVDPPIGVRLVAQGCTACGVCVRACPHDALHLSKTDVATLTHRVDACRADLACVELCPEGALAAGNTLTLTDLTKAESVELCRVATVPCPRCGMRHPSQSGDLCPTCAFRAAHPFGSAVPPAVRGPR